jgi:hypothetical protein
MFLRPPTHWEKRKNFTYFQRVAELVRRHGSNAASILDVGSLDCPYLDWFDWIPRRVSLDLDKPFQSPTVEGIKANFFTWLPREKFDVVLCLQVLEHITNVGTFARKLVNTAPHVIVSVPYMWPKGASKFHVQDPIDEAKIDRWFGRAPAERFICYDRPHPGIPEVKARRMVCYYPPLTP